MYCWLMFTRDSIRIYETTLIKLIQTEKKETMAENQLEQK